MTVIPELFGGMGNNFFQVCTAVSFSLKHNCEYLIPMRIKNPHYIFQQVFYSTKLTYLFTETKELPGTVNTYYEPFFHYKEIPKSDCDYLVLSGYWQSERYFSEHRTEILELLNIPYNLKKGWCSIHVRRTNYLNLPNIHPVVTGDYIEEAQIYMMNKGIFKFIYVSDDIEFCKNKLPQFHECEYEFSEGRTELEDLILASGCEGNISSNSSFSWFIHWLNRYENKIGIFPSVWFGKDIGHDTQDLYLSGSILI